MSHKLESFKCDAAHKQHCCDDFQLFRNIFVVVRPTSGTHFEMLLILVEHDFASLFGPLQMLLVRRLLGP